MQETSVYPSPVDVIERGRQCADLLASAAFLAVVDDLSNFHLSALVACAPGDPQRETRDYHHMMHSAVREIAQTVQQWAQAGQEQQDIYDTRDELA